MGIVLNQSFKNTVVTYFGFGLGAINILFLYTHFLTDEYHGLVAFVLSTANIMMPIFALGVHNTIIKFYSSFTATNIQNSFLIHMLILPLFVVLPVGLIGYFSYEFIAGLLSEENAIIKDHVWLIFVAAVCFSYFEIFYAWAKVHLQSVFGNFMKEVFHRVGVMILFVLIYFDIINVERFIYGVILIYIIRLIIMMFYAFGVHRPVFKLERIPKFNKIVRYTVLIILAGSIANIILEIDKFMIGEYLIIENVAYYGVAIYIATVIGVPARSMYQITNPLTAKMLNEKDQEGLEVLYKKSSINLFIISGLLFLLITLNINELYALIPEKFGDALFVVLIVSLAKLTNSIIGTSNSILFNSDYYRIVLYLGICLAILAVLLNMILIPRFDIDGAAMATFLAMVVYNFARVLFVYLKFKITPFTVGTVKVTMLIIFMALGFYFWDFTFHPIVNIALKSSLIAAMYIVIVYKGDFSEDITALITKTLQK